MMQKTNDKHNNKILT